MGLDLTRTFTKECQTEFSDKTGFIYPWQFKNHNLVSLNYDSLLVDLETYWTQLAQYREGFTYTETEVNIPNFFVKINGVHSKPKEYDKYVERY